MKALVLGCGSIGLRHIAHLQRLGVSQIEAADPDASARRRVRGRSIRVTALLKEALQRRPDVVLVCTPVSSHIPLAEEALQAGAHVFIEKPLCATPREAEGLRRIAASDGRVVQIGYNLRFHPAIRAAKRLVDGGRIGRILTAHLEFGLHLGKWWKGRDYRTSYMAKAELGGLLLDSSHEIDLAIFFLGPAAKAAAFGGKLSGLKIRGLDAVKGLLTMESGALVSLSTDCLQPTYTRRFLLIGEDAALQWDCPVGRADTSLGRLRICEKGGTAFRRVPVRGDPLDTYLDELRDFLVSVEKRRRSSVDLEEGLQVVRVAAAMEESIRTGRSVQVGG